MVVSGWNSLEPDAGSLVERDGTVTEPDGTVYRTDGSVQGCRRQLPGTRDAGAGWGRVRYPGKPGAGSPDRGKRGRGREATTM